MFICSHGNQTTPRKDELGEYRACLLCGKRIPWSWGDQPAIKPLHKELSGIERMEKELETADKKLMKSMGIR